MNDEEWGMFANAIKLYRQGKISRESFCKIWECAQQTNAFIQYCKELGVTDD